MLQYQVHLPILLVISALLVTIDQVSSAQLNIPPAGGLAPSQAQVYEANGQQIEHLNINTRIVGDQNLTRDDDAPPKQVNLPFRVEVEAVNPNEAKEASAEQPAQPTSTRISVSAGGSTNIPPKTQVRIENSTITVKPKSGAGQIQIDTNLISATLLASSVTVYLLSKGLVSF